jgi:putative spermidine/putrescine transport system substrate-binding protein
LSVLTFPRAAAPRAAFAAVLILTAAACGGRGPAPRPDVVSAPWDQLLAAARGTTVHWRMWRGDAAINAYVDDWIAPRMRETYGVTVIAVEGQGAELVNTLVTEREARGGSAGAASLMWINGETFSQLRREALLLTGWTERLPNARWLDTGSPIVARDFEQVAAGYESPWGLAQFALIYDEARVPVPPRSVPDLARWIRTHPGRFTHDQQFTGVTFLKSIMYAVGGGVASFQGGFAEPRYLSGRDALFIWLRSVRPYFWRRGETYPPDVAAMHRLFANNEIDFTMSNNANEVVNKIRQGVLPPRSRALLLEEGTIANAHYVGVPFNAPNPAGALVLADFLISPEAQLHKLRGEVWGDGTVLNTAILPEPWPSRFAEVARDAGALPLEEFAARARPEVAPAYHERLLDDWRRLIRNAP